MLDANPNQRLQGFIAQELYKVYPQAVIPGDDDGLIIKRAWAVDYGKLTPLLVKAVQELKADNDNVRLENGRLQEELKVIKADNDNIRRAIDELREAIGEGAILRRRD